MLTTHINVVFIGFLHHCKLDCCKKSILSLIGLGIVYSCSIPLSLVMHYCVRYIMVIMSCTWIIEPQCSHIVRCSITDLISKNRMTNPRPSTVSYSYTIFISMVNSRVGNNVFVMSGQMSSQYKICVDIGWSKHDELCNTS